jgi:hypothetical protein
MRENRSLLHQIQCSKGRTTPKRLTGRREQEHEQIGSRTGAVERTNHAPT